VNPHTNIYTSTKNCGCESIISVNVPQGFQGDGQTSVFVTDGILRCHWIDTLSRIGLALIENILVEIWKIGQWAPEFPVVSGGEVEDGQSER